MKLEEAIKQTKAFRSEYEKLSVNIMFTYSWMMDKTESIFKTHGLTNKQYNVLRILKGAGRKVSTCYIKERLLNKMSDVSRLVDRMHKNGLLLKESCPNDKRLVDVSLSKKGEEVLLEIAVLNDEIDKVFMNLSEKEADTVNSLLDKLRGN